MDNYQTLGSDTPFMQGNLPPLQSIDDTQDASPVSIDDGNKPSVTLSPETVESRANKADYGLEGKTDKTREDYVQAFNSGIEPDIRADVANQLDATKLSMVRQMIAQGKVQSIEELKALTTPTDPTSVVEDHYADRYMDNLNWPVKDASPDSWAFKTDGVPEAFMLKGKGLVARFEYLRTLQQNSEEEFKDLPWTDKAGFIAAGFATLGLRDELDVRGLVKGTNILSGLGRGTNLEIQANKLFDIQDDKAFKEEVDRIYNGFKADPDLRNQWLSAMIGMSNSEVFLNNAMTGLNVSPVGGFAKSIGEGLFKTAKTAVVDMVKATPAAISIPPKIVAPAIAGNLPESAIQKVVIDKINELKGDLNPTTQLMDRLAENSRVDVAQAEAAPGRFGREITNRIRDIYDASKEVFEQKMINANRVNVTPAVELEAQTRVIQKGLADMNRGVDNTILDVSKPLPVKGLNVYAHNVAIGTFDGELFKSTEEALSNAKLNGHVIKGSIIQTPENVAKAAEIDHLMAVARTQYSGEELADKLELLQNTRNKIPTHQEGATIEKQASKSGYELERTKNSPDYEMSKAAHTFNILDKEGKQAGIVVVTKFQDGKRIHISQIKATGSSDPVNSLGPKVIRDLLGQLKREFPDAEKITGFRESGSRGAAGAPEDAEMSLASIKQQGSGFYINRVVYLPIDKSFVTDGLITTRTGEYSVADYRKDFLEGNVSTAIPINDNWVARWASAVIGRGRSPALRLSLNENANRLAATHGPSVLLGMSEDGAKPIFKLSHRDKVDFGRLTNAAMKAFNEDSKIPGIWYNSPEEIEKWYLQNLNKPAPKKAIEAYFAFKSHMLQDLNVRSMNVLRNKMRIGAEQHAVTYLDKEGNAVTSDFFEGVKLQSLPSDSLKIMMVGDEDNKTRVILSSRVAGKGPKSREAINEDIKNGRAKLVQVLDAKERPLSALSGDRVEYVLSYKSESKPLSFAPLSRMGAGHFIPEWDWYMKQANMEVDGGVAHYNGDNTLMSFRTRAEAQEALPHMENVRQLFQKHAQKGLTAADEADIARFEGEGGAVAGSRDYLEQAAEANKLTGIPFNKHMEWYFGDEKGQGKMLNLHEPIQVVPKNTLIGQIDDFLQKRYSDKIFLDGTAEGSLLSKMMVEFTGERDSQGLYTMSNRGTQDNPIFAYEPAPYLDPSTAMTRAFSRLVKSTYIDDMKQFSTRHWLMQAAPYLDKTPEQLMAAPSWYLWHAEFRDNAPEDIRQILESNRKTAIDFLGKVSDWDAGAFNVMNNMADDIYNKVSKLDYADNALGKAARSVDRKFSLIPLAMIPLAKDPVGAIRSMAYLGNFLLKPAAFFTQVASMANIAFVAPRAAPSALFATTLYGMSRLYRSESALVRFDKLASEFTLTGFNVTDKLGLAHRFKPGQFTELMEAMENTGWEHYGNTHATSDSLSANPIRSKLGRASDIAQIPMAVGAASTRVGGWFAAGLEWYAQHPGQALDQQGISAIFNRASLYDHNMSSAMSSSLHTGVMSVTMQFQAYALRTMEMLTGKQLTPAEKSRLIIGTTLTWGAGGSAAMSAIPFGTYLYQQLKTGFGYVPGDSTIADTMLNGMASAMTAFITGGGDIKKGTWYDTGKLGTQSVDQLEQIFEHDHSVLSMTTGPSGQMAWSLANAAWSYKQVMTHPEYEFTPGESLQFLKELAFVRAGWQSYIAANYGVWMTKNMTKISNDATTAQAITSFLTGLKPVEYTDVFYTQKAIRDKEEQTRWFQRYHAILTSRGAMAAIDKDKDNAEKYFKNAHFILKTQIPEEKQGQTLQQSWNKYGSDLLTDVNWKWYMETTHDYESYRKLQQIKQQKAQ